MSSQPKQLPDIPDDEETTRKRFQDELRAAGIRPATEWGPRSDRKVFRKPSRLLGVFRDLLRLR